MCPGQVATVGQYGERDREGMTMATETIFDQPESLVRDLSDDDFLERYACDRFTATVLASRFATSSSTCARAS